MHILCVDASGKLILRAGSTPVSKRLRRSSALCALWSLVFGRTGKCSLPQALFNRERNFDRFIYAPVFPNRLIGVARSSKWAGRLDINSDGRIVLQPSRSIEGLVTVPKGSTPPTSRFEWAVNVVYPGPGELDFESFPREERFPGLDTALPNFFKHHP